MTNHETWLVNLWFSPQTKDDVILARETIEEAYAALPDFMRDFCNIHAIDWNELEAWFEDEGEDK